MQKHSEMSRFGTFNPNDFISSENCPFLMVDPALNSSHSEVFDALLDVITALFPADLSTV